MNPLRKPLQEVETRWDKVEETAVLSPLAKGMGPEISIIRPKTKEVMHEKGRSQYQYV